MNRALGMFFIVSFSLLWDTVYMHCNESMLMWQKSLQDFINETRDRIESKSALREQNLNATG